MVSVADRWLLVAVALSLVGLARPARAQTASAAEALFEEGRRAMEAGDYVVGCAKLAESQRIDPAGGTLMNLAACHERAGRTATAWAEFNDALAQAQRDGRQDRVVEASRRIAALSPRLARLSVTVGATKPEQLEVLLDGTLLGAASWGTPIPLDPGEHELRARAPGREPWTIRVMVEPGASHTIVVPRLESSFERTRPLDEQDAPSDAPGSRTPAFVVGGIAVIALGAGAGFGIEAASKKHGSEGDCSADGKACSPAGASLLRDASSAAWVSDIAFGVGAGALAIATYLFFAASHSSRAARTSWIVPVIGTDSFGLGARGQW